MGSSAAAADSRVRGPRAGRGRTLLVSSTGGHLSELVELHPRLAGVEPDPLWLVPDSDQTRALLCGHEVVDAPPVRPRDLAALPSAVAATDRLLQAHRVDCVVSTGAAVAVAAFAAARARGIPCHYVESAARVAGPSLSGRLVSALPGVRLWRQHDWEQPGRWQRVPSVFEGFRAADRAAREPGPLRVVVTVGTMTFPFGRLLDRVAAALPAGAEVLWQTGHTPGGDLPGDCRAWVPAAELGARIAAADVVVAHAGVGSALAALQAGVLPVLVPRRAAHGEHVDDHQAEIAGALAAWGVALTAEADTLDRALLTAAATRSVERRPAGSVPIPVTRRGS